MPVKSLQAVVLADNFSSHARPIVPETPDALILLCGIPVIEYTLEFLASSGIKEIILLCSSEKIEKYISRSPRFSNITVVVLSNCRSPLDALRFIGEKQLVQSDPFVLVDGNIVSNIYLKPILQEHKKRARKAITMVLRRAPSVEEILIATEGTRLLTFNEADTQVDSALFANRSQIRFHYDLMDCHLDVCSLEVLDLIRNEFDWTDLRKHMIEEIMSSEAYEFEIYAKIIAGYSARVIDFKSYDAVSKDVIRRWAYPVCLEKLDVPGSNLRYSSRNIYYGDNTVISRSAVIGANCVIGSGTRIGHNSVINDCVIGSNCVIGSGVHLQNTYIWNDVVIKDETHIVESLLCGPNCKIVHLGAQVVLARDEPGNLDNYSESDDEDSDLGLQADPFDSLLGEVYNTMRRFWNEEDATPKDGISRDDIELEVSILKPSFDATLVDWSAAIFETIYRFVSGDKKRLEFVQKWWHFLFLKYTDRDDDIASEIQVLQGLKKAYYDNEVYMVLSIRLLYLDDEVVGIMGIVSI